MSAINDKLKKYKKLNKGLIKSKKLSTQNDTSWLTKALIVGVLPSLGHLADVQAQCIGTTPFNNVMVPDNDDNGLMLDLDGGGADFEFVEKAANEGTLYIEGIGGAQVLGIYFGAGYPNTVDPNNYAANAIIDTATGANATRDDGFLFYSDGAGNWPAGTTSGYIGIKKGAKFGFIELTLTATVISPGVYDFFITVGPNSGFQNATTTVDVQAGLCSTLPVDLSDFVAKPTERSIMLNWQTASETNNAGFNIERSSDGENFERLSFVEGNGTSEIAHDYQFEDITAKKGQLYYYRLKQIDYSTQFSYSEVLSASIKSEIEIGEIYPNPSSIGIVNLDFNTSSEDRWNIAVFDVAGKQLLSELRTIEDGFSVQNFDLSTLSAGIYFIKIDNGNQNVYKKVVIE